MCLMSLEIIKLEKNDCPGCKILGMILDNEVDFPITVINLDENPEAVKEFNCLAAPVLVFEKHGVEFLRFSNGRDFSAENINKVISDHR